MSQKFIFTVINYLFAQFIHSFFVSIKLTRYWSWNLGVTFSVSQKLKDLSNIFIYQTNKLVLPKISSIKSEVYWVDFDKVRFQIKYNWGWTNLLDAYIKRYFNIKFIHPYYLSGNSPTTLTLNICLMNTSHVWYMCAMGESYAARWGFCIFWAKRAIQNLDQT